MLARDVVEAIGEGIHDTFGGGTAVQQAPEPQQAPVQAATAVEVADTVAPAEDTEAPSEPVDTALTEDTEEDTAEIDEPAERARLTEARTSPKAARSSTRSVRQAA